MRFATAVVFGLCAVLAISAAAEDAKGPARKGPAGARRPGGPGGEAMREQMLKRFDKDGDGKLSDEEKAAAMKDRGGRPGAPAAGRGPGGAGLQDIIKKFDKDGDGKLSDEEKAAARDAMPKGGAGRRPGAAGGKGKKPK